MADSLRLAILKQLTTWLSTEVRVANGYEHDLTDKVFRGRVLVGEDQKASLPCVSILDGFNPDREPVPASDNNDVQKWKWILLLQGWVADDKQNPTDPAEQLLGDVKRAVARWGSAICKLELEGTPAGDNVFEITIEPGTVRPPDELSSRAYFWLRIVLTVTESVDDPFWRP